MAAAAAPVVVPMAAAGTGPRTTIVKVIFENVLELFKTEIMKKTEPVKNMLEESITMDYFEDPIVALDGHTYNRESINRSMLNYNHFTSPLTREDIYEWNFPGTTHIANAVVAFRQITGIIDYTFGRHIMTKDEFTQSDVEQVLLGIAATLDRQLAPLLNTIFNDPWSNLPLETGCVLLRDGYTYNQTSVDAMPPQTHRSTRKHVTLYCCKDLKNAFSTIWLLVEQFKESEAYKAHTGF
jgi:hypothetical protein